MCNTPSLSIALCDAGVTYRKVVGPLIEVVDWLAAGGHHVHHQPISVAHCVARVVDELALNL